MRRYGDNGNDSAGDDDKTTSVGRVGLVLCRVASCALPATW
jgi:hypothetical protein